MVHKSLPVCLSRFQSPLDCCYCYTTLRLTFIYLLWEGPWGRAPLWRSERTYCELLLSSTMWVWGINLDSQAWWQVRSPTEPSCLSICIAFLKNYVFISEVLRLKAVTWPLAGNLRGPRSETFSVSRHDLINMCSDNYGRRPDILSILWKDCSSRVFSPASPSNSAGYDSADWAFVEQAGSLLC